MESLGDGEIDPHFQGSQGSRLACIPTGGLKTGRRDRYKYQVPVIGDRVALAPTRLQPISCVLVLFLVVFPHHNNGSSCQYHIVGGHKGALLLQDGIFCSRGYPKAVS